MCSNYRPVTQSDRLLTFFGVERPVGELPVELYPQGLAPFIWRRPSDLAREAQAGRFGIVPQWSDTMALGRRTYNCRSETAATKPSFRDAWKRGQRCIVPADWIYEPNWETGRAVRWRIGRADGWEPLGIAGLWARRTDPETGEIVLSFTMLTVNADHHELMRRFHRPGEEKRMVVILDPSEYDAWLDCPADQQASFMRQYPAERLQAEPAPLPGRGQPPVEPELDLD
jgi:putative SOS response-associated peptidase YedK